MIAVTERRRGLSRSNGSYKSKEKLVEAAKDGGLDEADNLEVPKLGRDVKLKE